MINDDDKQLAEDLGLASLTEEQQIASLAQFYETVTIRTGLALEDALTDEQLIAFTEVQSAGDDTATEAWVRNELPEYDAIVDAEKASVLRDIRESSASNR